MRSFWISPLADVERAASDIEARGPVAALVVAAAMFQDALPPAQLPMEVWERTMQVNRPVRISNHVRHPDGGVGGQHRQHCLDRSHCLDARPRHGTSKAAVVALTRNLAARPRRRHVNAVSPGSTLVPRVEERIRPAAMRRTGEFTALGRMVRLNEVAEAIESASSCASAITGVNLVVDAGWHVASTWAQYGMRHRRQKPASTVGIDENFRVAAIGCASVRRPVGAPSRGGISSAIGTPAEARARGRGSIAPSPGQPFAYGSVDQRGAVGFPNPGPSAAHSETSSSAMTQDRKPGCASDRNAARRWRCRNSRVRLRGPCVRPAQDRRYSSTGRIPDPR